VSILFLDSLYFLFTFPAGRSGCGKSFLLLQVVQHCASAEWIVIYIPRAVSLVNSTTSYVYDIRTQTYLQPAFALQILQRMLKVNTEVLDSVPLHEDLVLEKLSFLAGDSLSNVILAATKAKNRRVAQSPLVLEAVMRTLEKQTR
jgi:small subunit ribosomal protein S29